ncbi:transcriptional regulator family: C2H2 zinc finger [Paecilomyces variotii]|nr:transcriptional regulator family: C2H2 zinc finger [Paecilomyces variotii]KAJ9391465.1 transcriptional regulator family: C2H2 zinc finger [Paecilomyces variotii]
MLLHPSVRKDLITEPSRENYNYNNINNPFLLLQHQPSSSSPSQDNQLPPEWFTSRQLPLYQQQQSSTSSSTLQSPFQQTVDLDLHLHHHNASPCSSISASPTFSSPSFASNQSPATAISSDFSTAYDCGFSDAPSMSASSSFNPSIRIHPSPSSRQFQSQYTGSPMLAQQAGPNTHLSPAGFQNGGVLRGSGFQSQHKRASSGSSGGASNSPLAAAAPNGYNSQASFSPSTSLNGYETSLSKPLPTPVQTPVQNSFLAAPFQNGDNAEAEMAMRRAIMEQQRQNQQQQQQQQQQQRYQGSGEEESSFQYSLAPSVSSVSHNSPATPQTTYDEVDDGSKAIAHEFDGQNSNNAQMGVPKLDRTISDIYQDELYNPQIIPAPQLRKQPTNQHLYSPYRNLFADRLQAAHQGHISARSQSPANAMNRERSSPFRQGSPLAADFGAAPMPQNNITSGMTMSQQNSMNPGEPKTISPKDALLEYHETPEDNGLPSLFPSNQNGGDFNLADAMSLRRQSSSAFQPTQNYSAMEAFPSQYATQAAGLGQPYQFMQPMQQQQHQQQHPRSQPQNNSLIHHTPEFPASLPTMESTGSESHVDLSAPQRRQQQQQQQQPQAQPLSRRPDNTASDAGTYTCTYHGCTMRFETPAKLQKHKREAHRQTTPGGHLARDPQTGSLAMRNSQAGPHKCERINPSTGKPCNSIFSRPYDLTRHEDTIHNARKQKVRCHLCTEEKTFSRNDALTRHMRVVHPEVDWPGKQKRKGRD